MQTIHGMCYDCVIEMEHKLRVTGKYEEYEQQKIRENKKAWLKQAEEDVKALKEAFTQSHQYVTNADGVLETWEAQMTPEEFNEKVEKEFEKFKTDFIKTIEVKEKND
jgi:leucyl aminopeptidase